MTGNESDDDSDSGKHAAKVAADAALRAAHDVTDHNILQHTF